MVSSPWMQLTQRSIILEMRPETASLYAKTRMYLKQKGRPIPENDVWIAASCLEHRLALITNDTHFNSVDGLTIETVCRVGYAHRLLE